MRDTVAIPAGKTETEIEVGDRRVRLSNLSKAFWPDRGITKGDLLRYYADVAPLLVPHLRDRAMVMKRYPNGAAGEFFFMKRTPPNRPEWLRTCTISHRSGNRIDFPIVDDLASLLWVVNLGCIDLNQWYSRCDDTDRPDFLHFDLDPVEGTPFPVVRESALLVRAGLQALGMTPFAKTSGSKGIHVYVAIERGPLQKDVWRFAKAFAGSLERLYPDVITAEYTIAKRPSGRVLVDYNQNAWGRTLASIYSVRPRPMATVSTPVDWDEIAHGCTIDDFRLDNVRERLAERGDGWARLLEPAGRFSLETLFEPAAKPKSKRKRNES